MDRNEIKCKKKRGSSLSLFYFTFWIKHLIYSKKNKANSCVNKNLFTECCIIKPGISYRHDAAINIWHFADIFIIYYQ
jgi:hypothetical protein